jgi:hypothetical protein
MGRHVAQNSGHWWTDASTDQLRVDTMLSRSLRSLTGTANDEEAWIRIFTYYNQRACGNDRGYVPGEAVAVKVNLNNSSAKGEGNVVNVSPQVALAMVCRGESFTSFCRWNPLRNEGLAPF